MPSNTANRTTENRSQNPPVFPPEKLYYLARGFPFNRLTISQLKGILATHEAAIPSGSKAQTVQACEKYVAGNRGGILRKWTAEGEKLNISVGETWVGESNDIEGEDERLEGGAAFEIEMLEPENELTNALMGEEWYYLAPGFDVGILKKSDMQEIVERHRLRAQGADTKKKLITVWEQQVNAVRNHFVSTHRRAIAGEGKAPQQAMSDVKAGLTNGSSKGKGRTDVEAGLTNGSSKGKGRTDVVESPRGVDAIGETRVDDDESDVQSEHEVDAAFPSPSPSPSHNRGGRGVSQTHAVASSPQSQSKRGKSGTATTPNGGDTKQPRLTALELKMDGMEKRLEKMQQKLKRERDSVQTLTGRIGLLEEQVESFNNNGRESLLDDDDDGLEDGGFDGRDFD